MERKLMNQLLEWKQNIYRKPLILTGIRQVGKTWILKEFGNLYYENTAYFNFDENIEYKEFFEKTKNTDRIIEQLSFASGQNIYEVPLRYWSTLNPSYEVDFILQRKNMIIPIEVKADTNIKSSSLKKYKEKYQDKVKIRVRYSLENLQLDDDLLNIPLFMVDYTDKLIELALKEMEIK